MRSLDKIIEILNKHNIKGYTISKDTKGAISETGATNILEGRSTNPRKITIKLLNSYINERGLDPDNKQESIFVSKNIDEDNISNEDLEKCAEILIKNINRIQENDSFSSYMGMLRKHIELEVRKDYTELMNKLVSNKD